MIIFVLRCIRNAQRHCVGIGRIVSGATVRLNYSTLRVNNSVRTPHNHANTRVGYVIIYKVLGGGEPEGKRPLGKPRRRWEDNIKMDLK